jgi:hypothetical protein
MSHHQRYDIKSNDPAQNLISHICQLPMHVLTQIEQNPSSATITFVPPNQAELRILDKTYKVKVYPEKKDFVDLYRLPQTNCFAQVGVVLNKLMVETNSQDESLISKIRKETEVKNQKHRSINMISPGGKVLPSSKRKTVAPPSSSNNTAGKPPVQPTIVKPSYDKDVLQRVRQQSIAVNGGSNTNSSTTSSTTKRPTKRKAPASATTAAKRQRTTSSATAATTTSDNDGSESEATSNGGTEVSDSDHEDETAFESMFSRQQKSNQENVPLMIANKVSSTPKQHHKFFNYPVQTIRTEYEDLLQKVDISQSKPQMKGSQEISTVEQYETLQKEFADKYATYKLISELLASNTKLFSDMFQQYNELDDEDERRHLFEKMRQIFKLRYKEVQQLTRKYCCLHEELKETKELVKKFVNEHLIR